MVGPARLAGSSCLAMTVTWGTFFTAIRVCCHVRHPRTMHTGRSEYPEQQPAQPDLPGPRLYSHYK